MNRTEVIAATVFGGAGVAVVALLAAAHGRTSGTAGPRAGWRVPIPPRRAAGAGLAAIVTALITRWPVAAIGAAALVAAWPWLFGAAAAGRAAIARLEALALWTESLRDTIAGAVGLEQAIAAAVPAAADPIRPQLTQLQSRLAARQPLVSALYQLADELDDPSADLVVAALILNAELRGPGLQATLSALAASAREELDMRRRVEAGRASIRQGARIVVWVTIGFVATLIVFDRDYLAPYSTPMGQAVLTGVVALFAGGLVWLRRLSIVDIPGRFLASPAPSRAQRGATWQR